MPLLRPHATTSDRARSSARVRAISSASHRAETQRRYRWRSRGKRTGPERRTSMRRTRYTSTRRLIAAATSFSLLVLQCTPVMAGGRDGDPGRGPGSPDKNAVGTATPIKHLVVIFGENISFDHYFATYPFAENPPRGAEIPRRSVHTGGQRALGRAPHAQSELRQSGERRWCRQSVPTGPLAEPHRRPGS